MSRDESPYCSECGMSHEGAGLGCMRSDLISVEAIIEEFIADIEAAYSDTAKLETFKEEWFDLCNTYIKAKDYINERQ